ncbi:hypothetical protein ACWD9K_13605 [Streptomyces sp. 900116325]
MLPLATELPTPPPRTRRTADTEPEPDGVLTKARRDELTQEQLDALEELGVDWA